MRLERMEGFEVPQYKAIRYAVFIGPWKLGELITWEGQEDVRFMGKIAGDMMYCQDYANLTQFAEALKE